MILVANNDPSQRLTAEHVRALAECDDASSYRECGWFCLIGFKDGRRVVHAHANSEEDFLGLAAGMGYRWTGWSMVKMTAAERAERPCPYKAYALSAKGGRNARA